MRLISWNVNGLRACLKKGFSDFFRQIDADVFCVQETKATREQVDLDVPGYTDFWNSAEKKGYSGTAVFSKIQPLSVTYGINIAQHDREGRVITLEFDDYYLVNVYVPNSQRELTRLDYRMQWEDDFRAYVCNLDAIKSVIICGDLNVAHTELDIYNAKSNAGNAGFTIEERNKFSQLLDAGFCDFFRYMHPNKTDAYTWWSYMGTSREKNHGWRIDYFVGSQRLADSVKSTSIHPDVFGSDHCPISLET